MDAVAALDAVQLPAPPSAGAFKLRRLGSAHTPDEAGWHALMDSTHAELSAAAAAAVAAQQAAAAPPANEDQALDACTPLLRVSPEAAREEYLLNGQEGLDDLLAALEGGFEATATTPDAGGLTKVVLARRTDVAIEGQVEPLALLEALQERDPRAYQIMLQVRVGDVWGGGSMLCIQPHNQHPCGRPNGSAAGFGDNVRVPSPQLCLCCAPAKVQMPSGAAFLGSTPECLYTRTGTAVASEAVAGTRARGAGAAAGTGAAAGLVLVIPGFRLRVCGDEMSTRCRRAGPLTPGFAGNRSEFIIIAPQLLQAATWNRTFGWPLTCCAATRTMWSSRLCATGCSRWAAARWLAVCWLLFHRAAGVCHKQHGTAVLGCLHQLRPCVDGSHQSSAHSGSLDTAGSGGCVRARVCGCSQVGAEAGRGAAPVRQAERAGARSEVVLAVWSWRIG